MSRLIKQETKQIEDILRSTCQIFAGFTKQDRKNRGEKGVSLYTSADTLIANYITTKLHNLFPEDTIITEDGPGFKFEKSPVTWVMDPIDGTIPFMLGIPTYLVSLYRLGNNKIVSAYAYDPTRDLFYSTKYGEPTRCNGRVIKASKQKSLAGAHIAISGHGLDKLPWLYDALIQAGAYVIVQEGLVFRSMLVAGGLIDATIQPTFKMFESGAIRLLVEQAGGIVQSVSGSPLKLFVTNQNVVISNRFLCSLLKDLMNKQLKQANKQ